MRFQSKFGPMGWISVLNTVIFNLPWMLGNRMSWLDIFGAAVWPALVLLQLLFMRFIYWEADENGIREHRFCARRVVPYSQVTRVTGREIWGERRIQVTVEFLKPDAPKKRKLYLNPGNAAPLGELLRSRVPESAMQL